MLQEIESSSPSGEPPTAAPEGRAALRLCETEFEQLELDQIPKDHPVAKFADIYFPMMNGFLLPDAREIVALKQIQWMANWIQILEPVRRGLRLDFRTFDVDAPEEESEDSHWLADCFEGEFSVPRLKEASVAAVLREPLFSRGTVPNVRRNFIRQYRGVFPLFADTQPRMCLAVIAAETFLSVNPDES